MIILHAKLSSRMILLTNVWLMMQSTIILGRQSHWKNVINLQRKGANLYNLLHSIFLQSLLKMI